MSHTFTLLCKIILLFIFCTHNTVFAQTWESLGPNDHNQPYFGSASGTSVALHPLSGEAYLAYKAHGAVEGEGFVRKFNSITALWENVGGAFSAGAIGNINLNFTSDGTLYIAYSDSSNGSKATVKKFNYQTGQWQTVGVAGFSFGMISAPNLAVGPNDALYIGYSDSAINNKAVVKKFNGTAWINVGTEGFTSTAANSTSIAVGADGIVYASYCAWYGGSMKATVMKYNGTSWQVMGTEGFSSGGTSDTKIAINPVTNVPYIAYYDSFNGYKAKVRKFNGSDWEYVGAAGFSSSSVQRICFAISSDGTPFVGYGNDKATMMKFNGTAWETVGTEKFSVGAVYYTDIALIGNVPYMSFTDSFNASKPALMTFDGNTWNCLGGNMGISEEAIYLPDSVSESGSDMVITSDGTPYICYGEASNASFGNSPLTVKKYNYNTNAWEAVGIPGFATGGGPMMASYQNTPYVIFTLPNYPYNMSVMKYTESAWVNIGQAIPIPDGVGERDFTIAEDGTPYILFKDFGNAEKATVMKFNGSAWVLVGTAGFSAGQIYNPAITTDSQGIPYVLFTVVLEDDAPGVVMRFNGDSWQYTGNSIPAVPSDFKIGPDGFIYVACKEGNGFGTVRKLIENTWQIVGGQTFSEGAAISISLSIKPDGQLYVSYIDYESEMKATVMRYNGISWVTAGEPGISAGATHSLDMALSPDGHYSLISYGSPCMYAKAFDITCNTATPVAANQNFCGSATVAGLLAEGENIRWYSVEHFGSPLTPDIPLTTGTYYVAQMQNDCEGPRLAVEIIVNTVPPQAEGQSLCSGATVSSLSAQGESLKWYDVETEGEALDAETVLISGIYYVSQTLNDCESHRVEVNVQINITDQPMGQTSQSVTVNDLTDATLSDLIVVGNNILWYDAEGNLLPGYTQLENGMTYYATQTVEGCQSDVLPVTVEVLLNSGEFDKIALQHYPNPVIDKLQIVSNAIITHVAIYTIYGQKAGQYDFNANDCEINMANYMKGMYIIYAYDGNGTQKFKLLKE